MITTFITGANKGIGFEIAKQLLQGGAHVIVGARNQERGMTAIKALSSFGKVDLVLIDVANLNSVRTAAVELRKFDKLNLLINNAGIPGDMKKAGFDFTVDELLETHATDFIGPFELSKLLLPLLTVNRGRICNISIPIEPLPIFNAFAYQTAKAPLNVMTKSWGLTFKQRNIPVEIFAIMPGGVTTELNGYHTGPGMKTVQQAGKLIVDILKDGKTHNGEVINHDGTLADYMAGANL